MKIALVKQDIYPDLYVHSKTGKPEDFLKSTLMRTGPLGLVADYKADFYIIKEQKTKECQTYMRSLYISDTMKRQLQTLPANQLTESVFSFLKPLSDKGHCDFSINPDEIDWSIYDIVISINVAIPTNIVKKYQNTLWCYMFGEANADNRYPRYGYDCLLTQNITGAVANKPGVIDFPYTFLGQNTLENISKKIFKSPLKRNGIFAEINNTTKRPVTECPCIEKMSTKLKKKLPVYLHNQNIIENLKNLTCSKYFVKLEGRGIRGNSVIEAISAGCLVLMNPKDVIHSQLLPEDAWIHNEKEMIDKINFLETHPSEYKKLLAEEKKMVDFFVVKTPIESLKNALEAKRNGISFIKPTIKQNIKEILKVLNLQ